MSTSTWGLAGAELMAWCRTDALAHRCAGALMAHQAVEPCRTYWGEDEDACCWLAYEASDLANLVETYHSVEEVVTYLAGTTWWDPDVEGPERALAVAHDLGLL